MSPAENPVVAAPADAVVKEGPLASGLRFQPVALAALTVVLIGLCIYLAYPFLPALAWGVALTIIAWPLNVWFVRRTSRKTLAAAAATLVVVLVIVVPGLFISYQLAVEAASANERMKAENVDMTLRGTMTQAPALRGFVEWMDRANVDLDREIRGLIASYSQGASSLIEGSLVAVIQFVVALYILFNFLKDGPALRQSLRRLMPLSREESDRVFKSAADSVHANLYATVVTSLIDGVTGGVLWALLGLPSPVLWGIVLFFLSILPVLGTFIVWVPAAAYLGLKGHWGGAVALSTWGVGTAILVDSLLYIRLAGPRMRLHQVPAMLAFLGGLAVFGASGLVLGPAILAVAVAILEVWHRRVTQAEEAQAAEASAAATVTAAAEAGLLAGAPVPEPQGAAADQASVPDTGTGANAPAEGARAERRKARK